MIAVIDIENINILYLSKFYQHQVVFLIINFEEAVCHGEISQTDAMVLSCASVAGYTHFK